MSCGNWSLWLFFQFVYPWPIALWRRLLSNQPQEDGGTGGPGASQAYLALGRLTNYVWRHFVIWVGRSCCHAVRSTFLWCRTIMGHQDWRGGEGVAWPLLSVLPCLDNTLLNTQHTALHSHCFTQHTAWHKTHCSTHPTLLNTNTLLNTQHTAQHLTHAPFNT